MNENLADYPRIHKREMLVQGADADISLACLKLVDKHGLTNVEWLQILNHMTASCLKYMLREERHGDANKPSGLE
jgi:hypothetical protein